MALMPLSYGFDDRRIIKTIRATARPQTRIRRHQDEGVVALGVVAGAAGVGVELAEQCEAIRACSLRRCGHLRGLADDVDGAVVAPFCNGALLDARRLVRDTRGQTLLWARRRRGATAGPTFDRLQQILHQ